MSSFVRKHTWIWSIVGALVSWLLIAAVTHVFSITSLAVNATLASFLVFVAMGQMLVISGGDGGIDLSVPYTVTLAAYVSSGVMAASNGRLVVGILTALALGLVVGLVNAIVIVGLNIPPMVGSLAVGFLADSAVNVYASNARNGAPSPALGSFVRGSFLGVPVLVWLAVVLTAITAFVLGRTTAGRFLMSTGQNAAAARLSRVPVRLTRTLTYVASGLLAATAGILLAAYNNSAFLSMGTPYQMASVGAVVLGGSLIAGGRSTAVGTAGGAMFLILVLTLMQSSQMSIGMQYVGEGLLIMAVLLLADQTGRSAVKAKTREVLAEGPAAAPKEGMPA